jgi:hypothetical protein
VNGLIQITVDKHSLLQNYGSPCNTTIPTVPFTADAVTLRNNCELELQAQCGAMTTIFYLLLGIHRYFNF